MQRPGMVNLPEATTSDAPISERWPKTCITCDFLRSVAVASFSARPVFVMALAVFAAFMVLVAFMGAMAGEGRGSRWEGG